MREKTKKTKTKPLQKKDTGNILKHIFLVCVSVACVCVCGCAGVVVGVSAGVWLWVRAVRAWARV